MKKLKRKITADYYVLNVKLLPAQENSSKRYSDLIESWLRNDNAIITKGDKRHYYVLRELQKIEDGKIYYGVITKYVSFDRIDFIDNKTRKIIPRPIPDNIEGRVSEYEFVFVPSVHRFAIIKLGKINSDVKRLGAPLGKIQEIIKAAFDINLDVGQETIVEIEQEEFLFEEILNSDLLSLTFRVSYTNDDILPEGKEFIDNLLKKSHIQNFTGKLDSDNTGSISTEQGFVRGILELAKENGMVKATIKNNDGKKILNSLDFPMIKSVESEDNNNRFMIFLKGIHSFLTERKNGK